MEKWQYSRSERNAVVVLLVLIFVLILAKNPIIKAITTSKVEAIDSTKYFALIQQIENAQEDQYYQKNYSNKTTSFYSNSSNINSSNIKIEINSATIEDFDKLKGIGRVYAERIIKYRTMIGGFQTIEQLKSVYGIHDTVFQKFKNNVYVIPSKSKPKEIKKKIEINSATLDELNSLNGIGNVFAGRIIQFRDKLGGFSTLEQLKDVYGIHDSVYQKFKDQITIQPNTSIHKININTADYETLTSNPYLFSTLAKQIIGYRTKVKPFESIEDLKKLYYIKDHPDYYNKLLPYIEID